MSKKRPRGAAITPTRTNEERRTRVSQANVPSYTLAQALRIPTAIIAYGGTPIRPLRIAEALEMSNSSGTFRALCGASIAYGLTEGGYNAPQIALTQLGRRIVASTEEGDDQVAMREACLRPQIINSFLTRFNNRRIPPANIARNVLEELGVPRDKTERTLTLITENARHVGFLREIKGQQYVDVDTPAAVAMPSAQAADVSQPNDDNGSLEPTAERAEAVAAMPALSASAAITPGQANVPAADNNRVFISHGKNKDIVTQLKELLPLARFEPVVSIEKETVSKPVPDKVMEDMRSCFAAIIHVGKELKLFDADANEHIILNQNVLIEIGAAMALFGRRFILLVEQGATLPTNLQGLYEVRYEGERLGYDATMRLLKAFNDFRT
jgi:predicted nucleotide-binding protein